MASNYTTNYNLCQWEPTDQVQRTDFNADNAKIDTVLAGKLGRCELIRTVNGSGSSNSLTVPLDDIDWDTWEFVALSMTKDMREPNSIPKLNIRVNGGYTPCTNSADAGGLAIVNAMPFLLVLFPLRDSNRPVRYLYIAEPSGFGEAECTFSELENILFVQTKYIPSGEFLRIWGIR